MRTSVALFPFDSQLLPAVKLFEELQDKYTLRSLISHSGYGLTGRDAGYSRNHQSIGLTVTDALDLTDPTWDTLILSRTPSAEATIDNAKLESAAEHALRKGKSVLYFDCDITNVPEKMWSLSELYSGKIEIYGRDSHTPAISTFERGKFMHLDAPVVLVGGLVEEADTFEIVLRLTARLRADGHFVTGITRHALGRLFGLHTMNHFYINRSLNEAEKILELNQFIRRLEAVERPEVILLEAPDAVIKYSNSATNGFGICTYMLCQAVRPDYFVCCVPCDLAVGRLLEAISSDFEYRLGSPIHAAHVSNLVIDSMNLMQERSISYVHADLDAVRKQISTHKGGSSIPLFDVVGGGVEGLYSHLRGVTMLGAQENRGNVL